MILTGCISASERCQQRQIGAIQAVVGGMSIGRVTVTPEGAVPGEALKALDIEPLLSAENSTETFFQLVRTYARAAISGAVPKFLAPEEHGSVLAPDRPLPNLKTDKSPPG